MLRKEPDMAGQPYRPSNGTEGEIFMGQLCERCCNLGSADSDETPPCIILGRALGLKIDDKDYPGNVWVYDRNGQPTCRAYNQDLNDPLTWEDRTDWAVKDLFDDT